MTEITKDIAILGTRGIPAQHGGFETFAEELSLYLVSAGWNVSVYCPDESCSGLHVEDWKGIRLVHVPVKSSGAFSTLWFDLKTALHAAKESSLKLSLGYGTAIYWLIFKFSGKRNVCNMDGMEWQRKKWRYLHKFWLQINEKAACLLGDHLVADNPGIYDYYKKKVKSNRLTMIPYGAHHVDIADEKLLEPYGVATNDYLLVICRIEEDNSILEIVSAFSRLDSNYKLVIVGGVEFNSDPYHRKLRDAASDAVIFTGPVYQQNKVNALRKFAKLYLHGHRVGGTNPSLVEAMGAGLPVVAHDNPYNRWVAGSDQRFFQSESGCFDQLSEILKDESILTGMAHSSNKRFKERFQWKMVLHEYEELLYQQIAHTGNHK